MVRLKSVSEGMCLFQFRMVRLNYNLRKRFTNIRIFYYQVNKKSAINIF